MKSNNTGIHTAGDVTYLTLPAFVKLGFIRHAFSTRHGGVTEDEFLGSMNLGLSTGDDMKNIVKNYEIFCAAAGMDAKNTVISAQIHSDTVKEAKRCDAGKGVYAKRDYDDADALVTNEKNLALTVHSADCVPIIFADPSKKVIGAAHCGWRGTYKGLAAKTALTLKKLYGSCENDIFAGIGPCIHMCCYEVSRELYGDFLEKYPHAKDHMKKEGGKYFLDLSGINREILKNAGLREENISVSDLCTCCNKDDLFSHRGYGGKRGIMAAMIEII